jgi:branched-chain amino acid transport system ATP-binding protein
MQATTPILAAEGLHKRFGALVVLDGVSLSIGEGEALGIVGPNGAGKTTLLWVLAGAQRPSAGSIRFKDDDVTHLVAPARCRRGLARTHQIPRPFSGMTVFENAYVAASQAGGASGDEAYDIATDALAQCDMLKVANRPAETLGLLARKRLELARAVATRPSLLLLDEIGGGLTNAEADDLVGTIRALRRRGVSIVWIEHIVQVLVQVTERVICMDAGKIIADGTPQAVLADRNVVEAYLGGAPA